MHSYLVNGVFKNWNSEVGSFSSVIDVDFEVDSKENFYRLLGATEKFFIDNPVGGYAYMTIGIKNFQKIC